jgi:hypothetical protein
MNTDGTGQATNHLCLSEFIRHDNAFDVYIGWS